MSHENPYISRDVDIDAYVLQKNTAMSPYIVHMKTDVKFNPRKLIPSQFRPVEMQKNLDKRERKQIEDKFGQRINKVLEDIKKISNDGVKKIEELEEQVKRIDTEATSNSQTREDLQATKTKILNFQAEVKTLENVANNNENRLQGDKGAKTPPTGNRSDTAGAQPKKQQRERKPVYSASGRVIKNP